MTLIVKFLFRFILIVGSRIPSEQGSPNAARWHIIEFHNIRTILQYKRVHSLLHSASLHVSDLLLRQITRRQVFFEVPYLFAVDATGKLVSSARGRFPESNQTVVLAEGHDPGVTGAPLHVF